MRILKVVIPEIKSLIFAVKNTSSHTRRRVTIAVCYSLAASSWKTCKASLPEIEFKQCIGRVAVLAVKDIADNGECLIQ